MKKNTDTASPVAAHPVYLRSGFSLCRLRQTIIRTGFIILIVGFIAGAASCDGKSGSGKLSHKKKELTHSLLFVLGKDFYQYSDLFTYLSNVYDSESLKANLYILSYRDMTAKTKQPRLSIISERLAAQPVEALISIGIPEGGARILRTAQEKYPDLHIFSLLPVEEILPLEACSDIVVDFELPDSFAKADRAVDIPAHDVQTLVLCAVTAVEQINELPEQEPFPRFARAVATTVDILKEQGIAAWGGTPYTLHPYKDPELNIRSYNYLILSPPSTGGRADSEEPEMSAAGEKQ
ncbi:lipoprotein [Treponema sp. OMZ 838]|nr:lipoprotein [Treponema sp. OMZ 838]